MEAKSSLKDIATNTPPREVDPRENKTSALQQEEERGLAKAEQAVLDYKKAMEQRGAEAVITQEELNEIHRQCMTSASASLELELIKIGNVDHKPARDNFFKAAEDHLDELAGMQDVMISTLRTAADTAKEKYRVQMARVADDLEMVQDQDDTSGKTGLQKLLMAEEAARAEVRQSLEKVKCEPRMRPIIAKFWFSFEKELSAMLFDILQDKARVESLAVQNAVQKHRATLDKYNLRNPTLARLSMEHSSSRGRVREKIVRVSSDLPVVPLSLLYRAEEEMDRHYEELRAGIVAREAEGATNFVTLIVALVVIIAIIFYFLF